MSDYPEYGKDFDWMREQFIPLMDRTSEGPLPHNEEFAALSEKERYLYAVCQFDAETANGGIHQYLWNPSGDYFETCLKAFDAIGVPRAKRFLEAALDYYGESIRSLNPSERRELVDTMDIRDLNRSIPYEVERDIFSKLRRYFEG